MSISNPGGTSQTFLKDLEQSWRLCRFETQIMRWTCDLDTTTRDFAWACVVDIIRQHHPRRVWLYVKHVRWTISAEYAMLQQKYPGHARMYAAKTAALFRPAVEDLIVRGECCHTAVCLYEVCVNRT